jgi:hypothetical protein
VEVVVDAAVGVGEAVFFFEGEALAVEAAEEGAAGFGAEVEGEEVAGGHGGFVPDDGGICDLRFAICN